MSTAGHLAATEAALMRALGLSRALGFIARAETEYTGTVFCTSIELVNDCLEESLQAAVNHTGQMMQDRPQTQRPDLDAST